ncbi:MAG: DUF29 domain-containing protein [Prochlorothrix sp.]
MNPSSVNWSELYEQDYYAWLQRMTEQINNSQSTLRGLNRDLDWTHLLEELEDLSKRQRRELLNRLRVLLMHLLKWKYQPSELPYRGQGWLSTIVEQRSQLEGLLEDSPSLRLILEEDWTIVYERAVRDACKETGLAPDVFPKSCPFEIVEILNPNFLP